MILYSTYGLPDMVSAYQSQNRAQIYDFFLINEDYTNISYFCKLKFYG